MLIFCAYTVKTASVLDAIPNTVRFHDKNLLQTRIAILINLNFSPKKSDKKNLIAYFDKTKFFRSTIVNTVVHAACCYDNIACKTNTFFICVCLFRYVCLRQTN